MEEIKMKKQISFLIVLSILLLSCSSNIFSPKTNKKNDSENKITSKRVYTTNFTKEENPLSEGGKWICGKTTGIDWNDFASKPGYAYGLQSQSGFHDDDGIAILSGAWAADQWAQATVFIKLGTKGGNEVELHLRHTMYAHYSAGYEIYWSVNMSPPYVSITRWNGARGDWTIIKQIFGTQYGVANGDVIRATIIGNVISAYKNGVLQEQVSDSVFTTGAPGIGQWTDQEGCQNQLYGFTNFSAGDYGVK
jgi:hypothetical protein